MTLEQLITPLLASTDAEIASVLNTASVAKTDSTKYTWAGLALRFTTVATAGLRSALVQVPDVGPLVVEILTSTGIDFSLDETQLMLTQLAPALGADNVANLKAIGRYSVSPCIANGLPVATAESVAAARANIGVVAVESKMSTAINEIVWPLIASGGDWAAVKTAIAEVE